MSRFSLAHGHRPSAWFLGPTAVAFVLFGMAHGDFVWVGACFVALMSAYFTDFRTSWPRRYGWVRAGSLLLCLALLAYTYFQIVLSGGARLKYFPRFWFGPWFFTPSGLVASALLVWAWHLSFEERERGALLHFLTGWIVLCSGQFLQPSAMFVSLLMFYLSLLLLTLFLAPPGHQSQRTLWRPGGRQLFWFVVWGGLVGVGSWGVVMGLHSLDRNMAQLLGQLLHVPAYAGSLGGRGDMKLHRRRRIRLSSRLIASVQGPHSPRYLRTRVLTRYRRGLWSATLRERLTLSGQVVQHGLRFVLSQGEGGSSAVPHSLQRFRVESFVNLGGVLTLGYGALTLQTRTGVQCAKFERSAIFCTPSHRLNHYSFASLGGGQAFVQGRLASRPDRRFVPHAPSSSAVLSGASRPASAQTYRAVLAALAARARAVTRGRRGSALQAADAIASYFQRHYTYSFQVQLAKIGDPTVDFVLNRRPAYCQYFASGMALMMRSLGFSARVATGFLVKEEVRGFGERRWLIRQRDAHAWTEVFDPKSRRWVVFDATPPSPLTRPMLEPNRSQLSQLRLWLKVRWKETLSRLRERQLGAWLAEWSMGWLKSLLRPQGLMLFCGFFLGIWLFQRRKQLWGILRTLWWGLWSRGASKRSRSLQASPLHLEAQRLLLGLLASWQEQGLVLQPEETVEAFLKRLEALLQSRPELPTPPLDELRSCLALYQMLRFSPRLEQSEEAEHMLQRFRGQVEGLQSRLRPSSRR